MMNTMSELTKELAKAKLVGVGESSHGTHEFFINRIEIFKELIKNHEFKVIAFEDSVSVIKKINKCINGQGLKKELKIAFTQMYKVWQVQEVWDFFVWLSEHKEKIDIVGIDVDQSTVDPDNRDQAMSRKVISLAGENKALLWAHNEHVRKDITDGYPEIPMGRYLQAEFGSKYVSVGQFFGTGLFSAATIDPNNVENSSRDLKPQKIKLPRRDFL
jgi:erythromycin esterase-like protein